VAAGDPIGISVAEVEKTIIELRAFGEIMNVAPPQLDLILGRARAELEGRGPPSPPGPP